MLPAEVDRDFWDWANAKAVRLDAEKAEKAASAKLMAALGDADEGVLPDGQRVTWKEEKRNMPAQDARTITVRTLRAVTRALGSGKVRRALGVDPESPSKQPVEGERDACDPA